MDKVIQQALICEGVNENDYYIAVLDGSRCQTMKAFLKEMGRVFKFPSYYGQNLNALNDCLNDLEWLDKPNYILFIKNYGEFFSKEPEDVKNHVLELLEKVSKQWANVPNYDGEDIYRKRADFRIKLL